ncbi:hypothetical protein GJ744_004792 [Endocarpon pusillum]|uniref:Mitochondrial pyruvate carrier n=1 Tax=Endocarpon pusillum TaxID=364733 RepID=A0A8H7E1F5_9EURO|nr:hypothetical protein GJ744_004792 [Endocarpon pusillum]
MAVAIKAINAKIRSNKVLDYFCSTHFWGPASNFGIPLAAIVDIKKDPEMYVDGILYSTSSNLLPQKHPLEDVTSAKKDDRQMNYASTGGMSMRARLQSSLDAPKRISYLPPYPIPTEQGSKSSDGPLLSLFPLSTPEPLTSPYQDFS